MNKADITTKICSGLNKYFETEGVNPKTNLLYDLKADSIDFLEIVALLESEFNVLLPSGVDLQKFLIVENIINYVEEAILK